MARRARSFFRRYNLRPNSNRYHLVLSAHAKEVEEEFAVSMQVYCEELCTQGKAAQALWLAQMTKDVLASTPCLLYMLGSIYYALHRPMDAVSFFSSACEQRPLFWDALEALDNLKAAGCDRWHFRMLNDSARNAAYAAALHVSAGRRVLDVGTGTGLLAMYAAGAGAKHVVACDINPIMCSVATHCLAQNGVHDVEVVLGAADTTTGPFDVVVTELADSGLLGERMIPALRSVRALLAPDAIIIPHAATVHAAIVDSSYMRARSRLLVDEDGCLHGVHVAAVAVCLEEPYTCEPLYAVPHRMLTRPCVVHRVPLGRAVFDEPAPLAAPPADAWLQGGRFCGPALGHTSTVLPVVADGVADCVAVWFDLHLDATHSISTAPDRGATCGWDQALIFLQPSAAAGARGVMCGDTLQLDVHHGDDGLRCSVTRDPRDGGVAVARDVPGPAGPGGEAVPRATLLVGEGDMARLNDAAFHTAFVRAVAAGAGARPATVLDLADGWSLRPLLCAQLPHVARVVCVQPGPDAARALGLLAADPRNGVGRCDVCSTLAAVTDEADGGDADVDVLVADVVDSSGLLVPGVLRDVIAARPRLRPGAAVVPRRVAARCVLVQSPWLVEQNRIMGGRCGGVDVGALNAFGTGRYRELDMAVFPHTRLSDEHTLCVLDLAHAAPLPDGCMSLAADRVDVPVQGAGTADALLVWYDLDLATDISLSTGQSGSHWRHAAVMLDSADVAGGDVFHLRARCSVVYGLHVTHTISRK